MRANVEIPSSLLVIQQIATIFMIENRFRAYTLTIYNSYCR